MRGVSVVGCRLRDLSDMNEAKWDSKSVHDMSERYLKRTMWVIGSVMLGSDDSDGEYRTEGDDGVERKIEEDEEDEEDIPPGLSVVFQYRPLYNHQAFG